MKRPLWLFLLCCAICLAPAVLAAPPTPGAPAAEPDAGALINRMIDAHGGWDVFQKQGSMKVEYRFFNPALDPNAFPSKVATVMLGSAVQVRIDYKRGAVATSMGFDGQAAWMSFDGVATDDGGAIAQAGFSTRTAAWMLRLPFVLHGGGYTATHEGSVPRVQGQGTWDKVRVQFPEAWQVLYINHDTSLLERAEWVIPELDNRMEIADFELPAQARPVKLFDSVTIRESDGKGAAASDDAMRLVILKREYSVGATDATFKAPPAAPPAPAPPAGSAKP